VKGNSITEGTDGIRVQQDQNSIEENFLSRQDNGIKFEVSGNYLANNSAPGNTTAFNLGSTDQRDGGGNWDGTVP
jgi:parallel beta-helix repeat protein